MKKVILTLCTGIIMSGAAYSLYNAANNYGLATISLPPAIAAQQDNTSGGDNTDDGPTECNRPWLLCNYVQVSIEFEYPVYSGPTGYITLTDGSKIKLDLEKWYQIKEKSVNCEYTGMVSDVCDTRRKGSSLISANQISDGTN